MIQILFALAFLFSAWAAWRRSPLYSTRATLRTAGVVALLLAGGMMLVWAGVRLTQGRSIGLTMTIMAIVVLVDTWALIFGIVLCSTPASARPVLPAGAVEVTANRRAAKRWILRVAIVVAMMLAAGALAPGTPQILLLTFGGFLGFLGLVLMPVFYWAKRNADLAESSVENDPWVRWTYDSGEWRAWARIQRQRLEVAPTNPPPKHQAWRLAGAMAVAAAGVFLLCPGPMLWKVGYVAIVFAILLLIVYFSRRSQRGAGAALERRMLGAEPEVSFGDRGLVANGAFMPWLSTDTWLVSAARDQRQPPSLLFHFVRQIPNPYGGPSELLIDQAVLLPADVEQDVARISAELDAFCPNAAVDFE